MDGGKVGQTAARVQGGSSGPLNSPRGRFTAECAEHAEMRARATHGDALSEQVIGAALEVHRMLGPGLLESAYEQCLCHELAQRGIAHARQVPLPIIYKGCSLDCGYRMDIVVEQCLLLEVKAVDQLMRIHEAQILTYLRLSGLKIGFLMNFNEVLLKHGLRRFVLSATACSARSAVNE